VRIIETMTTTSYPGIESLKWLDAKSVAQLIEVEHPQTIAVILANLDPEQGSQVLAGLPEFLRHDVVLRLATMQEVQPDVLAHLSDVLQEAFKVSAGTRGQTVSGTAILADMLGKVDKSVESGILNKMAEKNPQLADSIRALMFVFDDLVRVDDRGMQELLKETTKEDLPIALRGASQEVKDKFFKNMSSRAAETLKDDMESRGPVKVSDVEKAQQNILKVCKKLEESGRIVTGGGGDALV
jgi:flagellar motor switch protein FliG